MGKVIETSSETAFDSLNTMNLSNLETNNSVLARLIEEVQYEETTALASRYDRTHNRHNR